MFKKEINSLADIVIEGEAQKKAEGPTQGTNKSWSVIVVEAVGRDHSLLQSKFHTVKSDILGCKSSQNGRKYKI